MPLDAQQLRARAKYRSSLTLYRPTRDSRTCSLQSLSQHTSRGAHGAYTDWFAARCPLHIVIILFSLFSVLYLVNSALPLRVSLLVTKRGLENGPWDKNSNARHGWARVPQPDRLSDVIQLTMFSAWN